jgi:hypothetical protein
LLNNKLDLLSEAYEIKLNPLIEQIFCAHQPKKQKKGKINRLLKPATVFDSVT